MQTTISTASLEAKPHPADTSTSPTKRSGSPMPPTASLSSTQPTPPPEVEATLTKLTSHKNVIGCLVLSRPEGLIIRSGGSLFDPSGPGARERAERLRRIVRMVRNVNDSLTREVEMVGQGEKKDGDDSEDFFDEKVSGLERKYLEN